MSEAEKMEDMKVRKWEDRRELGRGKRAEKWCQVSVKGGQRFLNSEVRPVVVR
jgi:hypothetical protein